MTYRTLDEAAIALRVTRRWLLDWLRSHPVDTHGRPYHTGTRRNKLFSEQHITRIDAAREASLCPSRSTRPAKARARTGRSAAPTSASALTEAAALTRSPLLARFLDGSNGQSSAESSPKSPRLKLVVDS